MRSFYIKYKTSLAEARSLGNTLLIKLNVFFLFLTFGLMAQDSDIPFSVQENLFNYNQPETLGLNVAAGTETFTIFKPNSFENRYNNGVVVFPFKGVLYAQWQSSVKDEDAPDTKLVFSKSIDGKTWTDPQLLITPKQGCIYTSGGWWSNGELLVAYINVWPNQPDKPRQGYVEYKTSTDGINWSDPLPVLDNKNNPVRGIFEQDPHALPNGRIINAIHLQPGLIVTPFFTDDPLGIKGWTKGIMQNLPHQENISRELEPSWFYRNDGTIVMVFRDQESSFKKLASISRDKGNTWTQPALTDMPDSRSKQCAGNLPDGTAYQVNNPSGNKSRIPLVITLSKDGSLFDKACLLRAGGKDLQNLRYPGKYKRLGYHYPKSVVWEDYLYIAYSTNKEDIQLTRVPLKSLSY